MTLTGKPGPSDKVYPATKLAAIVETQVADGAPVREVLSDVGVCPDELHSSETLVSLHQPLTTCRNALRLSRDPSLAFRIGLSIHVSAYGMYGYAILCGADFRKTMNFCVKYHVLATPLVALSFAERGALAIWTIDPVFHCLIDDELYQFIVEMQMGVQESNAARNWRHSVDGSTLQAEPATARARVGEPIVAGVSGPRRSSDASGPSRTPEWADSTVRSMSLSSFSSSDLADIATTSSSAPMAATAATSGLTRRGLGLDGRERKDDCPLSIRP